VRRLRYYRQERGLTQTKLAQLTRVPQPLISLAECGRWILDADDLAAIGKVLGVPGETLLKHVEVIEEQTKVVAEQSA
jgi:transcriptional regulator with XRE-family HTH domain